MFKMFLHFWAFRFNFMG